GGGKIEGEGEGVKEEIGVKKEVTEVTEVKKEGEDDDNDDDDEDEDDNDDNDDDDDRSTGSSSSSESYETKKRRVLAERALIQKELEQGSMTTLDLQGYKKLLREVYFDPRIMGIEEIGIVQACKLSVERCRPDVRQAVLADVVVTGGMSRGRGFVKEFERRLRSEIDDGYEVKVRWEDEGEGPRRAAKPRAKVAPRKEEKVVQIGQTRRMREAAAAAAAAAEKKKGTDATKAAATTQAVVKVETQPALATTAGKEGAKPQGQKMTKGKVADHATYKVGQLVEGRWQRQSLWYKAVVVREGGTKIDGTKTWDLSYEDGDFDKEIEGRYVRERKFR
ncbi:hypothetical protein TrRE_jg5194, partial [Triparma retinervis]